MDSWTDTDTNDEGKCNHQLSVCVCVIKLTVPSHRFAIAVPAMLIIYTVRLFINLAINEYDMVAMNPDSPTKN